MENRPHFKPGPIKYTRGYGIRIFISKLINTIFISIALAIMALTIYVYANQPVKHINGSEFITAERVHRMLRPGDEIIVVETEDYNIFTPLKRFITPQVTYLADVIAGPYGTIKSSNIENEYTISYSNDTVTINIIDVDQEYLVKEYVIRKKDEYGNYLSEVDLIITKDEILGLIKSN